VNGGAIGGLARLGRQAVVVLAWILILIALALATRATINSGRAQECCVAGPAVAGLAAATTGAIKRPRAPGRAQPALANQNVSGR
jgi:hypothetical protein